MGDQLTLDDAPDVRGSDPDTSRRAAAKVITTANHDCMLVLATLIALGERATSFEVWRRLNETSTRRWKENVISKRMSSLKDNGYVRDSGERRPGSSSVPCIVWTPTALGRDTAEQVAA